MTLRERSWIRRPALAVSLFGLTLAAMGLAAPLASAAEPYEKFLEGLRQRDMHDASILYIESIRKRSDLPEEIRETLTYEEGVSLLEKGRDILDPAIRNRVLDEAAAKFNAFIKENPASSRIPAAGKQLAQILRVRADGLVMQARRPGANAAEAKKQLTEAQTLYADALKAYDKSEEQLRTKVDEFESYIDPKEVERIKARDRARSDYLQVRLEKGTAMYDSATAYDVADKKREELLTKSREELDDFAKRYRKYFAGQYATMYQGRAMMSLAEASLAQAEKVKDPKQKNALKQAAANHRKMATALFRQLLAVPDSDPNVRNLQYQVARLAMVNYLEADPPQVTDLVKLGQSWVQLFRGREGQTEDALSIKWLLAQGLKERYDTTKDANEKKNVQRDILALADDVARYQNPFKDQAAQLAADLRGVDVEGGEPTDFYSARTLAKRAMDTVRTLSEQARQAKDPAEKKKLEGEAAAATTEAFDNFQKALELRDVVGTPGQEPPSLEDINQVRYYLCYLYYQQGDHWRSAVMGEYIARNHPDSAGARPGATIAMSSYGTLFNTASLGGGSADFESRKMEEIANMIIERYPDDNVAAQARLVLIEAARKAGDRSRALEHLNAVAEDAPDRAQVELKVGDFLWKWYLTQSQLPTESDLRPSEEELESAQAKATELLQSGIKRLSQGGSSGGLDPTVLLAKLSLAQVYARSAQYPKALELLTAKDDGLLTIVEKDAPVTKQMAGFRPEVFKLALQAYVNDKQQDKAVAIMESLDKEFANEGAAAQQKLTNIYLTLGRELKEDLQRFRDAGREADYQQTLTAVQAFLGRIGSRTDGTNFVILNWVADTFYNLGEAAVGPSAKGLYNDAAKTYQTILARTNPSFWPTQNTEAYKLRTQIQLAKALRGGGQFEPALKQLETAIAKAGPNLDLQREAALTYEEWGDKANGEAALSASSTRKYSGLMIAMIGVPDPSDPTRQKKTIWGWDYLSRVLQSFVARLEKETSDLKAAGQTAEAAQRAELVARYRDQFFEARYHMAQCFHKYALKQTDTDDRKKYLSNAEKTITLMASPFPDMGGQEWYAKFDTLLKKIQQDGGTPRPEGLAPIVPPPGERTADIRPLQ